MIRKLAEVHNERGVKAVEYGIMGEVLIWSLNHTLGPSVFTLDCRKAWIRIFCRMIRIMIPSAVQYELENGEAQRLRTKLQDEMDIATDSMMRSSQNSPVNSKYVATASNFSQMNASCSNYSASSFATVAVSVETA